MFRFILTRYLLYEELEIILKNKLINEVLNILYSEFRI